MKSYTHYLLIGFSIAVLLNLTAVSELAAQTTYRVESTEDLGDSNLDDGIFSPKTLRSAIENANRFGGGKITFVYDKQVYNLGYPLPQINVQIHFEGKGSTINGDRGNGYSSTHGLYLNSGASGSIIEDLKLTGFAASALTIKCNNSRFEALEIFNNDIAILLNNASGNSFTGRTIAYTDFIIHNNSKNDASWTMQMDENSHNNTIEYVSFGFDPLNANNDFGNKRNALLIRGRGNIVKNSFFSYNRGTGITVWHKEAHQEQTIIQNCSFQFDHVANSAVGSDNYLDSTNQKIGIMIDRSYNVIIKRCVFGSHRNYGIDFTGSSSNNIIIDSNMFALVPDRNFSVTNDGSRRIGQAAIRTAGKNISITNNSFGKASTAIALFSAENTTIQRNQIGIKIGDSVYSSNTGIFIGDKAINLTIGHENDPKLFNRIIGTTGNCIWMQSFDSTKNIVIGYNELGVHLPLSHNLPCGLSGIRINGNISSLKLLNNSISSKVSAATIDSLSTNFAPKVTYQPSKITIRRNQLGTNLGDSSQLLQNDAGLVLDGCTDVDVTENSIIRSNHGIWCRSGLSRGIKIFSNMIGGVSNANNANRGDGILINRQCSDVSVGLLNTPLSGNVISRNMGSAVNVEDTKSNKILIVYNIMKDNDNGSIGLGGIKAYYDNNSDKDSLDMDDGANSLQNAPEITSIDATNATIVKYKATLRGEPGKKYLINEYLTIPYGNDSLHFIPALEHYNEYQIEMPLSGFIELEKETTTPLANLINAGINTIALTATNQDLETSQLGRPALLNKNDTLVDLQVLYDTNESRALGNQVTAKLLIVNNSTIDVANIVTIDSIHNNFIIDSFYVDKDTAQIIGQSIYYFLRSLAAKDTAVLMVYGHQDVDGLHKRTAYVYSSHIETNLRNNRDTFEVNVLKLSVSETDNSKNVIYYSSGNTLNIDVNFEFKNASLFTLIGNNVPCTMMNDGSTKTLIGLPYGIYILSLFDTSNRETTYLIHHY